MATDLIREALTLIFGNIGQALRASVGPFLLGLLAAFVILWVAGVNLPMLVMAMMTMRLPGMAVAGLILAGVVMYLALAWSAVAWHRFGIFGERVRLLPAYPEAKVWRYAGRSVMVSGMVVLAALPAGWLAGLILGLGGGAPLLGSFLGFAISVGLMWLSLRLSLMLPATAAGRPMTLKASWEETAPLSPMLVQAAVIILLLQMVIGLVLGLLPLGLTGGALVELLLAWFTLMLGSSVLTVIYRQIYGRS